MAASAFLIYNKAKEKIGDGRILLGSTVTKMQLHTSASNASTFTISLASSIDNQVTGSNGYTTGGKSLANIDWTVGASAKQYKFDADDVVWTATGGNIANIKFGVIRTSTSATGGHALCWSKLTTAQFTLTSTNTLTVQFNSAGIFTLV